MRNIPSITALALLAVALLASCAKSNENPDVRDGRADEPEIEMIASIESQAGNIGRSIVDLAAVRSALQSLTASSQVSDTAGLRSADESLGERIDGLKGYAGELKSRDNSQWLEATLATLGQYEATCATVAAIEAKYGAADGKLSEKIRTCAGSLASWINVQFGGSYTVALADATVSELEARMAAAEGVSREAMDSLTAELTTAEKEVAAALTAVSGTYRAAIDSTIRLSDGRMTKSIQSNITKANDEAESTNARVVLIEIAVDNLVDRVSDLEDRIQSVTVVPAFSDGRVKSSSKGIVEVSLIVEPAGALSGIPAGGLKDSVSLYVMKTDRQDSESGVAMETLAIADAEVSDSGKGIVIIHSDISKFLDNDSDSALFVAINVRNGISDCTSDFAGVRVSAGVDEARESVRNLFNQVYNIYSPENMIGGAPIEALTDLYHCYAQGDPTQYYQGTLAAGNKGRFPSLGSIYETVRDCRKLAEKVELSADISESERSNILGEVYTIMASRYFDAFRNYGGLYLTDENDNLKEKRATAWETVEFIDGLLQKAIDEPGFVWCSEAADQFVTRASARALRAKLWLFAASPLFNDDMPYCTGSWSEYAWFGKKDQTLWNKCLQYCTEFFDDNAANGNYYKLVEPVGTTTADYRNAFRQAYRYPNDAVHHEKLFDTPAGAVPSSMSECFRQEYALPTAELMECFGMADGTNYQFGISGEDIFENRDPRFYETVAVSAQSSGPVLKNYKWVLDYSDLNYRPVSVAYIRLAEIYLISAEAKAETGDMAGALDDINLVRARVGLGRIEEKNPYSYLQYNKDNLINEILRERACELVAECGDRFYDIVRRKRSDLLTLPLNIYSPDRVSIETNPRIWWKDSWSDKWYLDPIPPESVGDDSSQQNPGW